MTSKRLQAQFNQRRYVGKTIAITGSVGKTSATLMLVSLVKPDHRVLSRGRRNVGNGMLRLMRSLTGPADYVVQELSAYPGREFSKILRLLRVDVAVVTRVGLDHASFFRTEDGVADAKGRLVEKVARGGFACLNADDPRCRAMASRTEQRTILYGEADDAELRAENVSAVWPSRMSFDLAVGGERHHVRTAMVGTIFLPSVLAALSVVHGLGLDLGEAIRRLGTLQPQLQRLSVLEGVGQHTYLRDTFKASHWSTVALVEDLHKWGAVRKVFVLGDMSDIRSDNSRRYRQVLRLASAHADLVIGVGRSESQARRLVDVPNIVAAATVYEVADILRDQPPSLVILKSNGTYPLELMFDKMEPVEAFAG